MDHGLLETVENMRRGLSEYLGRQRRALLGQFFTPAPIARFMAESFEARQPVLRVVDFRAKHLLCLQPEPNTVPPIYTLPPAAWLCRMA